MCPILLLPVRAPGRFALREFRAGGQRQPYIAGAFVFSRVSATESREAVTERLRQGTIGRHDNLTAARFRARIILAEHNALVSEALSTWGSGWLLTEHQSPTGPKSLLPKAPANVLGLLIPVGIIAARRE